MPVPRSIRPRPAARHPAGIRPTEPTHPTPPPADAPPPAPAAEAAEPVLYTPEQAAQLLQVRPSWLRRRAAARAIPCRFLGKHLRFSRADIDAIAHAAAQPARAAGHHPRPTT
jgi:excisionase family DNA binding protein